MARIASGLVYVGIRGQVVALDRRTGGAVWSTKLTGSSFVTVQRDGDLLLATASGEVFALHPKTGDLMWKNPLKGFGVGLTTLAGDHGNAMPGATTAIAAEVARRHAAAT